MDLNHILVFFPIAWLMGRWVPLRWRAASILVASLLAIYWLQPASPIRNLDFWLPGAAIFLTVLVWAITQQKRSLRIRSNVVQLAVVVFTIGSLALLRYLGPLCCLTATRPPALQQVIPTLFIAVILLFATSRYLAQKTWGIILVAVGIGVIFLILKTPLLAVAGSASLRSLTGQTISLASPIDLSWLGFSYLAFRLLHVLRDHQNGLVGQCSLAEFSAYALFFPAYTAGPIDRLQHFRNELNASTSQIDSDLRTSGLTSRMLSPQLVQGSKRIILGIFKKFVLADSLALVSLNHQNAAQVESSFWIWILIYAFSLRIYLDFSGYTDIALGLGTLLGIKLPENFDRPYTRGNLTMFWNSWHITLAQWFRAYFFNPLTRAMRNHPGKIPVWGMVLIGQLSTMLLIGLWHGVTLNFAIWGIWHAAGLFIHNRWANWLRAHPQFLPHSKPAVVLSQALSWLVTFHYITLGWIWFALPDPQAALNTFRILFVY